MQLWRRARRARQRGRRRETGPGSKIKVHLAHPHLALANEQVFPSKRRVSNWTVILLGIIEGITEFLPVSSTGHLLLAEAWLKPARYPSEVFNVVIQGGAVLAVILAFAGRLREMARNWRAPATRDYVIKLGVAFVITVIGAVILKKLGLKLGQNPVPVAWATLVGGVVILGVERWLRPVPGSAQITWPVAVAVGCAQLLAAAFPGTSRSGASIIMSLGFGVSRPAATEFSFLLGVPTLLSASGYAVLSLARHPEAHEPLGQLVLGTVVSAITAFAAVKWLLRFVQTHTFVLFGWYRVVLGALILVCAR